jgi:glycosyltransferase involved in cell wall biosynthesis
MRGRMWRLYADARRLATRSGTAAAALEAVGDVSRSDPQWTAELAVRHVAYRRSIDVSVDPVAVVCVTSRPHLLCQTIDAVSRQTCNHRELVLVTNSDRYDGVDLEAHADRLAADGCSTKILRVPEERSLGSCLNEAMAATDARFVAKFDDDDLYGAEYLADSLRALSYSGAGVVGKHTYYAYLAASDRTVLRFPTREFSYSSTLAGGTLVIDRQRTGSVSFPDVSIGEDREFIARCHRRGISTFSADRFNFVQVRSGDNTWSIGDDEFAATTIPVAAGLPLDSINL